MDTENPQPVQFIQVSEQQAGQRLDNFLFLHMKGVPKGHVYKVIRRGEVRVNKGRAKNIYKLKAGDIVRVPPVKVAASRESATIPSGFITELQSRVMYEDEGLLVLNKPAGMAVHGGSGLSFGLIEGVRAIRPDTEFLELVHRLDRDTSGCLLIAKKRSTLRKLHELFRSNQIHKTYTALLYGRLHRKQVRVTAPLQKYVMQGGERMVQVSSEGKSSETVFERQQLFKSATLVTAYPKTGRTHQIRVHAQSLRHAIVGDERYSPPELRKQFRQLGFKRLFLHASSLDYFDPESKNHVHFEAPLDSSLQALLDQLE